MALSGVRDINQAVWAHLNNRGPVVLAQLPDGYIHRIMRARRVRGVLQVRSLTTGEWHVPAVAYRA